MKWATIGHPDFLKINLDLKEICSNNTTVSGTASGCHETTTKWLANNHI